MNLHSERYWDTFVEAGAGVQAQAGAVSDLLTQAHQSGHAVYVCGNGGSAAIATHFACDLAWGRRGQGRFGIRAISLNDQLSLLSALENDVPHAETLAWMVGCFGREGDVLVAISASGNSSNVVGAADAAHEAGMSVVGLVGFDGGKLRAQADLSIWVPAQDFGVVEDVHAVLCHTIARGVAERLNAADAAAAR